MHSDRICGALAVVVVAFVESCSAVPLVGATRRDPGRWVAVGEVALCEASSEKATAR